MESNGGSGEVHAGVKRRWAENESSVADNDRFAKRFNLLNLGGPTNGNSNYYIPVHPVSKSSSSTPAILPTTSPRSAVKDGGSMQVDDTPNRVYIHDLDEELAGMESDEEKLVFLPDIEKKLSRIPRQVLTGIKPDEHEGQELVLYQVPKSLTFDADHDSVRKAIVDTRQRAREKAVEDARRQDMNCKYDQSATGNTTETAHGYSSGYDAGDPDVDDSDAMDLD